MKAGDKVKILECHTIPELVGKEGKIAATVDTEMSKYPLVVMIEGYPVPFGFREEEVEVVGETEIPDVFKEMDKPE